MSTAEPAFGAIHALLSRILLKEADAEMMHALAQPEIADVMEALQPGFTAHIRGPWTAARLDEEAAEYARLFLLPGGVSPFAAAWIEGAEGAVRADLQHGITAVYDELRIRPADFGLGNVPADHIGMLLALTSEALRRDADGPAVLHSSELLRRWAPTFARQLTRESESPLYKAAGRLLMELCTES